jgi:hypothetical protein
LCSYLLELVSPSVFQSHALHVLTGISSIDLLDLLDPFSVTNMSSQITPTLLLTVSTFVTIIKPALVVLIVCAVWLGISVPLLFVLFYFSTAKSRCKAIFKFNVISVSMGIIMGVLNVAVLVGEGILDLTISNRRSDS